MVELLEIKSNKRYLMKKILNYILLSVNIIALIALLTVVFNPFIECGWTQKTIDIWNSTLINLLCGVHLSTIFYYLLVYFPELSKGKDAMKKSIPHLQFIILRMALFIAYTAKENNIPVDENDIYYQNVPFRIDTQIDIEKPEIRFAYYERSGSQLKKTKGFAYDISDLKAHSNIVLYRLNKILSIPYIEYNDDLFQILISLRDCCLLNVLEEHDLLHKEKNEKMNWKSSVAFTTGIDEYHILYKSLLKYAKPTKCYVIKDN